MVSAHFDPTPMTSVGVGVLVVWRGRVLAGRRGPGAGRGQGCLALAGGKVESGEDPATAAVRETWEETGLDVVIVHPQGHDHPFPAPFLVTVPTDTTMLSLWYRARLRNPDHHIAVALERTKCNDWQFFLPKHLHLLSTAQPVPSQEEWLPWEKLRAALPDLITFSV